MALLLLLHFIIAWGVPSFEGDTFLLSVELVMRESNVICSLLTHVIFRNVSGPEEGELEGERWPDATTTQGLFLLPSGYLESFPFAPFQPFLNAFFSGNRGRKRRRRQVGAYLPVHVSFFLSVDCVSV